MTSFSGKCFEVAHNFMFIRKKIACSLNCGQLNLTGHTGHLMKIFIKQPHNPLFFCNVKTELQNSIHLSVFFSPLLRNNLVDLIYRVFRKSI
jgi:hypothetical protein